MYADYKSLMCKDINSDGTFNEFEVRKPLFTSKELSKYIETVNLTEGAILNITKIPANLKFNGGLKCKKIPISIGCHITGDMVYQERGGKELHFTDDTLYISKVSPRCRGVKRSDNCFASIGIMFYPGSERLIFGNSLSLLKERYRVLFKDDGHFGIEKHRMSPFIKALVGSIMNCSLTSHKREFYMRSKGIEFLNYVFSEYMIKDGSGVNKSVLQPGEADKIKGLKEYLNSHMDSSPTINEMSKITGLNDCKLKAGFKEVFGTTIYGYIKAEKMSRAKVMLETGRYSVSEIAWDIGYTNVSHFIKAFKKHYCVTPGQMLVQIKSDISRHEIKHA